MKSLKPLLVSLFLLVGCATSTPEVVLVKEDLPPKKTFTKLEMPVDNTMGSIYESYIKAIDQYNQLLMYYNFIYKSRETSK